MDKLRTSLPLIVDMYKKDLKDGREKIYLH